MILYYKANIIGCQKVNGLDDDFIMHKKRLKLHIICKKTYRIVANIWQTYT